MFIKNCIFDPTSFSSKSDTEDFNRARLAVTPQTIHQRRSCFRPPQYSHDVAEIRDNAAKPHASIARAQIANTAVLA
jgi:hypothetical protein